MTEETTTESTDSLVDIDVSDVEQPQQATETPEPEAPSIPEGLPEELWDKEANQVKSDELLKAYQSEAKQKADLRKALSKKGGTPAESEDDYKIELGEDLQGYDLSEDPSMPFAKKAALEAGLSPEQFNEFVGKYMAGLKEGELLKPAEPRLTEEEQKTLQEAEDKKFREEQMKILGEEGQKDLSLLANHVKTLYGKGRLTDEQVEKFKELAYDAEGVQVLAKLIKIDQGQQIIPTQHAIESNMLTKDELDAMGLDPRMKTDPAFRKRRTQGYRELEAKGLL